MNDSADMNDGPEKTADLATAARALGDALGALETALDPVIGRLGGLERQAREAEALQEDRTKLVGSAKRNSRNSPARRARNWTARSRRCATRSPDRQAGRPRRWARSV
jgi:hypothetical protein